MRIINCYEASFAAGGQIYGGSVNGIPLLEAGNSSGNNSVPELVITASRPNNAVDATLSAALGAATRGAVVALAEGFAVGAGLAAGSSFLVAAPVVAAGLGAYVAYQAFTR